MTQTVDLGLVCRATDDGVAIELHDTHFEPLLKLVREAKNEAYKRRDGRGGMFREIEHRLQKAAWLKQGPKCAGCGQFHRVVDGGRPHPSGDGFICDDPHEREVPHQCAYWASRCNNGPFGMRAKAEAARHEA